ncbi:3782_t:CDS:2 [Dentiscutata heterogama]|uniref:3782_t:CDS:1 n=1 Tax=Dentiscutata heterogama TaxID=1316150 RepID=A0ACA9LHP5_9GLOM|nr:3782_t:CDS:2 [Dentiscutata heterogama]
MNAINLFLLILVLALLVQAGSDFSTSFAVLVYVQCGTKLPNCPFFETLDGQCIKVEQSKVCVVKGIYNTLPGGLPGDECGGIVGATSPANTTVGTCPSYDAIGNALVGSTTAPTFSWLCCDSGSCTVPVNVVDPNELMLAETPSEGVLDLPVGVELTDLPVCAELLELSVCAEILGLPVCAKILGLPVCAEHSFDSTR